MGNNLFDIDEGHQRDASDNRGRLIDKDDIQLCEDVHAQMLTNQHPMLPG